MSDHWIFIDDDMEIRQGDVIRRVAHGDHPHDTFGFIITADCDIAQGKMGDRLTWLEIVRSDLYLEAYWAADQLRRLIDKQARLACESLNALIRRSELELSIMTPSSLCTWLAEADGRSIIQAVGQTHKAPDPRLVTMIDALQIALGRVGPVSNLERLRLVWSRLGRDHKAQQSMIKDAFNGDQGFPDSLLVPELPNTSGYGFIILLRSMSTLYSSELFKSEIDARINNQPHAFHRIGRFSDNLRFAVAQKLAFLFSRIGMTASYEDACEAATDLLIEKIYVNSGEMT